MKKLETKNIITLGITVFVLYLCIHYWSTVSGLLGTVFEALMPLLIGGIIAYLLNILMSFYERHFFPNTKKTIIKKCRRAICLLLSIVSLLGVSGVIIGLIVPQLVSCVKLLVTELPAAFEDVVLQLEQADILSKDLIRKLSEVNFQSEIRQIIEAVFSGIGNILNLFSSVVSSVISGVTSTFLAFAFAVYLLIGKDKLAGQADRLMKRWMKDGLYKKVRYVMAVVNDSFHRFVVGQCTEAVILGTLCTIGMLILRLPYAVMIGAVIAFTALIPMVGAFLGGAVGAFLIFMVSPVKALIFLIFLIVLQQVEGNLIYPRVVGSSIGLPGIWVLAAVTIGGGVFGIFGMLIGVPIAAALYRLIKNDLHQYEKTNIVVNTSTEETTQEEVIKS